jgi:hypothetical protein
VVAVQLTVPVEQTGNPAEMTVVPCAPRSLGNDPFKLPVLKLRFAIANGVGGRLCDQRNVQMLPGMSVIRKLITPVQPGVTVRQTDPRPPECVPL